MSSVMLPTWECVSCTRRVVARRDRCNGLRIVERVIVLSCGLKLSRVNEPQVE